MSEPIQHPISKLGFFIEYTSSWLIEVREAATTLEKARQKPHVLTEDDVERARHGYTQEAEDLTLFEDTMTRWRTQKNLTAKQCTGLVTLDSNLTQIREINTSAQELIDYLEPRTLERVLATPDIELGLSTLLNHVRGEHPNATN